MINQINMNFFIFYLFLFNSHEVKGLSTAYMTKQENVNKQTNKQTNKHKTFEQQTDKKAHKKTQKKKLRN